VAVGEGLRDTPRGDLIDSDQAIVAGTGTGDALLNPLREEGKAPGRAVRVFGQRSCQASEEFTMRRVYGGITNAVKR